MSRLKNYDHLIKTTNIVRQRNLELHKQISDLEKEVEFWKNKLIKTKKISRKRKRMIERAITFTYYNSSNYKLKNDMVKLDKWLKE